ncbi:hypothetical protein ACOSP7_010882 [Xanthoceras sorbifolium]
MYQNQRHRSRSRNQNRLLKFYFFVVMKVTGRPLIDAGALRKHSHIHGGRQYVCHYKGCGKNYESSLYF